MAHRHRGGEAGDDSRASLAASRQLGATRTSPTADDQCIVGSTAATSPPRLPWRGHPVGDIPLIRRRREPPPSGTRPASCLGHHAGSAARRITTSACGEQFMWRPARPRPRRHVRSGPFSRDTTPARHGQTSSGAQGSPLRSEPSPRPVNAVNRRHHHHRPRSHGGDRQQELFGRLECSEPHQHGFGGQSGRGTPGRAAFGDQPPQRPGIGGRPDDLDAAAARWRDTGQKGSRGSRARMHGVRGRTPRLPVPAPARAQRRRPFDGRYSGCG